MMSTACLLRSSGDVAAVAQTASLAIGSHPALPSFLGHALRVFSYLETREQFHVAADIRNSSLDLDAARLVFRRKLRPLPDELLARALLIGHAGRHGTRTRVPLRFGAARDADVVCRNILRSRSDRLRAKQNGGKRQQHRELHHVRFPKRALLPPVAGSRIGVLIGIDQTNGRAPTPSRRRSG